MATSGKKGKKSKGKAIALQDFLSNTPSTAATTPVPVKVRSWADECDEDEDEKPVLIDLPTGPRACRVFDDETVPQQGPFMAHLTNLPYEIKDYDIQEFFAHLNVLSVRVPVHDSDPSRIRGFGFVEFETRDDLIDAISTPDPTLRNRRFRIDISNENDQKRNSRYDKGNRYDNFGAENGSNSNWRQRAEGSMSNDKDSDNRRGGYGYNKDRFRDGERDRESNDSGGNWRSGDRPVDSPPAQRKQFSGGDRYGGSDRAGGIQRSDRGGGGGGGGGNDRGGRGGFYEERGNRRDRDPELPPERPKIVLQPRTLPLPKQEIIEDTDPDTMSGNEGDVDGGGGEHINDDDDSQRGSSDDVRAKPQPIPAEKIFGSAKPVDTAAREREIEERLAERERERKMKDAEDREREKEEREKEREQQMAAESAADALAESNIDDENEDKETAMEKDSEVISWRRNPEDRDNNSGSEDKRRPQSPSSNRRYSPDRRGGPQKRNDDRRRYNNNNNNQNNNNNRDQRDRDSNRDNRMQRDHRDNQRDNRRDGGRDNRDNRDRDRDRDRDHRNNNNNNNNRLRDPKEIELPKYQPKATPDLSVSNGFSGLRDEEDI